MYNDYRTQTGKSPLTAEQYLTPNGYLLPFIIADLPDDADREKFLSILNVWEQQNGNLTENSIFINTNRDYSIINPIYMPLEPNASSVDYLK